MSSRTSSAAAFLLALAACSADADAGAGEQGGTLVDCALDGETTFTRACAVERSEHEGTLFLVVRHPDGAFRRFEVLRDGRGLAAADGAQAAVTNMSDGDLVVGVGADRYRFPATIRGDGAGE
ncbi:hypothetical protein GRI75_12270 [Altererythrobacter soli]|uniref:Lipoprotein n=1 Tax=Croceibacterium soli TaxID=1739690 RepID=A0A6I4UV34_9SPHN|nr:hypothetical protein [Croceibacterium soli]MXP42416.1 hypothetical protein [Croceibacterium soli]